MELSGFSELTYGITYRIRRTKEYNYVFLCTQTASIYVFDRNWNPIKKVILADNESYIDYQLKIWNDQIILDPLQASWLFYPEYYVDYTGYIPAADQVLFFDLKGNLLKTTDIPRQKKCTSEMIYEENLFIQQPGYNDTLYVVSTDGNIKQEVDLDFSFHKKDHILLSSDKILFAGAYSQCREWQRRGLLLISEHPQESLTLFPMNKDALTLSSAFNTGNTEMLSELMERWYTADIQPKTEFDHIWEKEAYALYEMIFPGIYSFSRTNHQYSNGTPFYNPEYHLIPHNISIEVSDSLFLNDTGKTTSYLFWRYLPTDIKYEITDFRPELTLDLKIIYSTDEISAALSSYLSLSQKDHFEQQRRKFLKDYLTIPILDGTIGVIPIIYGYYDYSHIVFDRDYRKAIITSNYKGRYSCFKELGVWKTLRE